MRMKSKETNRARLLRTVMEEGFAVDEARLYLDTHPDSKKAQSFFDRHNEARRKVVNAYEAAYGPLTTDNLEATKNGWTWIDPPFPWEGDEN